MEVDAIGLGADEARAAIEIAKFRGVWPIVCSKQKCSVAPVYAVMVSRPQKQILTVAACEAHRDEVRDAFFAAQQK